MKLAQLDYKVIDKRIPQTFATRHKINKHENMVPQYYSNYKENHHIA